MSRTILLTVTLAALIAAPSAFAHGMRQQPPLLGALVNIGNHGSIANITANVGARPSYHAPSALADVRANVLNGVVRADVALGQASAHDSSLLNLNASVLSGGVGNSRDRW